VGGTFYNPPEAAFPAEYKGRYFYADMCSGWVRTLDPLTRETELFATGLTNPLDLEFAPDGSMYYLTRGAGDIWSGKYPGQLWRVRYKAEAE
jgi:glucose/arabinose dehydrogenase